MKILIINGPNLNLLGKRDKNHYGDFSLEVLENKITSKFPQHSFTFYQSNIEGELIDKIQSSGDNYNALIINPGGYAHSSVAIRDALADSGIPKIEVHLSHLAKREEFRQNLITATGCDGYISGFKENGYFAAVYLLEMQNQVK
ncbi:MAG: 3-dehydroquinate dehydratase [Ignavibacterium sp.]|nr:MAG: 3-dehydroquinate dehydratase [Ignavibacterium sp.]